MDISLWHLTLAWVVLYSLVSLVINRTENAPDFLTLQGPLTLIHTQRGRNAIEYLAGRFPRFWPVWGVAGVILFFVGLALGTVLVAFSAVQVINQPSSATLAKEPQNLLVIPGVNDYLPLEAAPALVLSLLIAMVVHELGHAIYCRTGDIDIKSTGLVLLALIPAGAFVEPDEESQENATRWARLKMVSAGVMNNLGVTVIAMVVLVAVVPALISPASGAAIGGVLPNSPADDAGIEAGERIVEVNGMDVTSTDDFNTVLDDQSRFVRVKTADGETHTVTRRVFVVAAHETASLNLGATITHVDGQKVAMYDEYVAALEAAPSPVVELTTSDGRSVEHVAGARVQVNEDSTLSAQANDNGVVYITSIGDTRVLDAGDLSEALSESENVVDIAGVRETADGFETFTAEYEVSDEGSQFVATEGIGGISTAEMGVEFFPADQYLGYITADGHSVWASLVLIVFLPFASIAGLPYNFAGFTPNIVGFYQVTPALEPIAPLVFFGASLAFWTVWINVNLALFNCLPTFALDGGHYVRYGLESIAARLGSANPKQDSKLYARAIMGLVLVCLGAMMLIPPLLG